jgi:hypothetical protein
MENAMKIGFGLLVLVLIGVLAVRESRAEDADQDKHSPNAASSIVEHGTSPPPSGGNAASEEGTKGAGDAASNSETKGADDIDTRITVQPRRTGGKSENGGKTKTKFTLAGVKNPHRRVFSLSRASGQSARNAVSAPVPQRTGTEPPISGHSIILSTPRFGAGNIGGTTGVGGHTGIVKLEPAPVIPGSSNTNLHAPTVVNRGISGTSVARHGLVQAGIGGPTKASGGLNGTSIRTVH